MDKLTDPKGDSISSSSDSSLGKEGEQTDSLAIKSKAEALKAARNKIFLGADNIGNVSGMTEILEEGLVEEKEELQSGAESIVQASDSSRKEVSAATIGRMMGLVTASEFNLLEKKVDLVSTRVSNLIVKIDKLANMLSEIPNGSDLDRIDVQIGSLRTLLKDFLGSGEVAPAPSKATPERSDDRVSSGTILSNED